MSGCVPAVLNPVAKDERKLPPQHMNSYTYSSPSKKTQQKLLNQQAQIQMNFLDDDAI